MMGVIPLSDQLYPFWVLSQAGYGLESYNLRVSQWNGDSPRDQDDRDIVRLTVSVKLLEARVQPNI